MTVTRTDSFSVRITAVVSAPVANSLSRSEGISIDDARELSRTSTSGQHTQPGLTFGGRNSQLILSALHTLRAQFGDGSARALVLSPALGVVGESGGVPRTSFTFRQAAKAGLWNADDVRSTLSTELRDAAVVLFLLSGDALMALNGLPSPAEGQRFLAFVGSGQVEAARAEGVVVVPIAKDSLREFGAGSIDIKGRLFDLLSGALSRERQQLWDQLLHDASDGSLKAAVRRQLRLESGIKDD